MTDEEVKKLTFFDKVKCAGNRLLKASGKLVYTKAKEAPSYISQLSKNVSHNLADTPVQQMGKSSVKVKYVDVFDRMLEDEKRGGLF